MRLGAQLWALELELPRSMRRKWKFSLLARVVGRLYAWNVLPMPEASIKEEDSLSYWRLVEDFARLALAQMPSTDADWRLSDLKPSEADQEILDRAGRTRDDLIRDADMLLSDLRAEIAYGEPDREGAGEVMRA